MKNKTLYFGIFFLLFLKVAYPSQKRLFAAHELSNLNLTTKYRGLQKKYSRQLCRGGDETKFKRYFKNFKGDGYFIPVYPKGDLDRGTIKEHLPLLLEKKKWIRKQISYLIKNKDFRTYKQMVKSLRNQLKVLLKKKQMYWEIDKKRIKDRKAYLKLKDSQRSYLKFKKNYFRFLKQVPFLLSFKYPLDHLSMRAEYEQYKRRKDRKGKIKANHIYFYRRVVQDGALDLNKKRGDKAFRMALDTIRNDLNNDLFIISENLRYDLSYVLETFSTYFSYGHFRLLQRLREWHARTERNIKFYNNLLNNKSKEGEVLSKMARATFNLKELALKKQAKSYEFWTKQSELMRSLFVIETILYNEVGTFDGKDGLERRDITQVILNRKEVKKYRSLSKRDHLYSYLNLDLQKKVNEFPWLNILFKTGEFSFTYFFIPSGVRLFCPEMTRQGRFIRNQNLKIALELLKKPKYEFKALRYFSRYSILGRINMASIWDEYEPLQERAGRILKRDRTLKKHLKKGFYHYLYSFKDPLGGKFHVFNIKKKNIVYSPEGEHFYTYRNPHFFTYFKRKSERLRGQ